MTLPPSLKIRDLTQRGRTVPLEGDGGSIYELLLALWLLFDPEFSVDDDVNREWFPKLVESTPDDLRAEIEFLGRGECSLLSALRGVVTTAPKPRDIDPVLDWLARLDPSEFRRWILAYECQIPEDQDLLERAIHGESEALEDVLGDTGDVLAHYRSVFSLGSEQLRDRVVAVLRRFRTEVYQPFEQEYGRVIERAVEAVNALGKGADPERVIENVTNGLDYRLQPGVSRVVLVPSVVVRPWAVIDRYEDTLLVVYPVDEEYLTGDEDAPAPWMVKIYKALADEKRLRILRRLSEGPARLEDLAEMLGVSKSTVHHHVGLLRAAGLLRVVVDKAAGLKNYTLRPAVLPEARHALSDYLGADVERTLVREEEE